MAFPIVWFDLHFYYFQVKGLDVDNLYVPHIQANKPRKQRCHTYRASIVCTEGWAFIFVTVLNSIFYFAVLQPICPHLATLS
jgi:hypothetical protein